MPRRRPSLASPCNAAQTAQAGGYRLEAGRAIVGPSGLKLATLHRVEIAARDHPDGASGAYTLSPTEADRLARQIVDALNGAPDRPG